MASQAQRGYETVQKATPSPAYERRYRAYERSRVRRHARESIAQYRAKAGGRNRTELVNGPATFKRAVPAGHNGGNVTPSSAVGPDLGEVRSRERHSPAGLAR